MPSSRLSRYHRHLCQQSHPRFFAFCFYFATVFHNNSHNIVNNNMQPLLFNTLQVRSALGQGGGPGSGSGGNQRRKLSFRNVSNVVVQLLHSIKYSVEVPFSNIAAAPFVHSTSTCNSNNNQGRTVTIQAVWPVIKRFGISFSVSN